VLPVHGPTPSPATPIRLDLPAAGGWRGGSGSSLIMGATGQRPIGGDSAGPDTYARRTCRYGYCPRLSYSEPINRICLQRIHVLPNTTQNQCHCVSASVSLLLLYLESNLSNRPSWLQCEVASFTHHLCSHDSGDPGDELGDGEEEGPARSMSSGGRVVREGV
jgi:hypothetical protein